ncbi:hypothetical protein MMC07_005671 [Pseudocyphellaria aurata]|nr:hypothetical protein [Pseudocyphellaria aurata]
MAGLVSSKSDHAAAPDGNFNIDFGPFETGDLPQQLLANDASSPSTVTSHDLPVRRRAASPSSITEVDSIELAQSRSESDAISQVPSEIVGRRHIYWFSPALMTGLFIAGVFFAIGHHFYYESLHGQEVGDMKRQQWPLRFGNVFSFLVKSCLAASAGIACVQWMWKTIRRSYITIEGIDAAFSAQENLLALLNWEMLSKMQTGTFIALVIWCIPFAALITPATLSVRPTYQYMETSEKVASLNMSMSTLNSTTAYDEIAFLARFTEFENNNLRVRGPSQALARIVSASAATGDIFRIAKPLPGPNMTYETEFHIPAIKCENSSSAVTRSTTAAAAIAARSVIGEIAAGEGKNRSVPFLDMEHLVYLIDSNTTLSIGYYAEEVQEFDHNAQPRNQIRIVVADRDDDNSTKPLFLTCTLWNASSIFNISYKDDVQSVQSEITTYVNEIVAPEFVTREWIPDPTSLADVAYTMFFTAISGQLTGLVWANVSGNDSNYNDAANIKTTILTGASEYVSMMRNFSIYTPDKFQGFSSLNKPLSALIEELSPRNEYSYEYHNLVLAYGLAIFITLLSIILGWSAVVSNGMSYDFTVSSIIGTSQNPDLADLFRHQTPGAQPLDRQIRKTKLRFGAVVPRLSGNSAGLSGQRAAFGLEGTVS